MLLTGLRRKQSSGAASLCSVIAAKVATFLKPPQRDLAISGDSDWTPMADGVDFGFVRLCDSETFVLACEVTLPALVCSVAYAPCGTRLAVGDVDGFVRLLTMDTLQMQKTMLGGG